MTLSDAAWSGRTEGTTFNLHPLPNSQVHKDKISYANAPLPSTKKRSAPAEEQIPARVPNKQTLAGIC